MTDAGCEFETDGAAHQLEALYKFWMFKFYTFMQFRCRCCSGNVI